MILSVICSKYCRFQKISNFQILMIIHKDDEMGDVFIDSRGGLPSIKGQIQILEPLLSNRALKEGDYWRIIPFKWLEVIIGFYYL
jgi:hypothetical protein